MRAGNSGRSYNVHGQRGWTARTAKATPTFEPGSAARSPSSRWHPPMSAPACWPGFWHPSATTPNPDGIWRFAGTVSRASTAKDRL
jgi:hypothetical protein